MTDRSLLPAGAVADVPRIDLTAEPVAADQVAAGSPTTALATLAEVGGVAVGVWEMSEGAMRDTEDDEVFVVVSGRATVSFEEVPGRPEGLRAIEIGPGSLVRLTAGMRTVWTVHETLRKVWVA